MLLALAVEKTGTYEQVHFSVTHHPQNDAPDLLRSIAEFRAITSNEDRFSVFTPDRLLGSLAIQRSPALVRWADWYRDLYMYA